MSKSILIGITGGIGSGKSLVSDYLASLGEYVINADKAAREAVLPGEPGNKLIKKEFGDMYFKEDDTLDREKLAQLVFADPKRISRLNDILHPLILESIYKETKNISGRVFIEAPLLIQAGMHRKMDYVWLVIASEAERVRRVMQRDGSDKASVMLRIESQMRDDEMAAFADEIIENSASPKVLYEKIDGLLKKPEYSR